MLSANYENFILPFQSYFFHNLFHWLRLRRRVLNSNDKDQHLSLWEGVTWTEVLSILPLSVLA